MRFNQFRTDVIIGSSACRNRFYWDNKSFPTRWEAIEKSSWISHLTDCRRTEVRSGVAKSRKQYGFKRLLCASAALKISAYASIPAILCLAHTQINSFKTARHWKCVRRGWVFAFETADVLTPINGEKVKNRRAGVFSAYRFRLLATLKGGKRKCRTAVRHFFLGLDYINICFN